jgi:hypothetical protein
MILLNVLISVGSISATLVCIREYRRRQQLRLIIARRRNGYLRVEVGQSKNEAGIVMQHFVSARIVCKNNEALHYKQIDMRENDWEEELATQVTVNYIWAKDPSLSLIELTIRRRFSGRPANCAISVSLQRS